MFFSSFFVVLRGWLARRKYARLREIHQLQLVFIRKFSDDISTTGQLYKTKMDQHCQYDRKRKLKAKSIEEDDEQVEKTLNFFDSIIDPYLLDQETQDQQRTKSDRKITQPIKTNGHPIQQVKQDFDVNSLLRSSGIFLDCFSGKYLYEYIFISIVIIITKSSSSSCGYSCITFSSISKYSLSFRTNDISCN